MKQIDHLLAGYGPRREERLDYLEKLMGDSAARHARAGSSALAGTGQASPGNSGKGLPFFPTGRAADPGSGCSASKDPGRAACSGLLHRKGIMQGSTPFEHFAL